MKKDLHFFFVFSIEVQKGFHLDTGQTSKKGSFNSFNSGKVVFPSQCDAVSVARLIDQVFYNLEEPEGSLEDLPQPGLLLHLPLMPFQQSGGDTLRPCGRTGSRAGVCRRR